MTNKKLSICMVSHNYRPYTGGVVSSLDALCTALEELGHSVTLVTLDYGTQEQDPAYVKRLVCPVSFCYSRKYYAFPAFASFQLQALMLEIKPDIVHVHHPFFLAHHAVRLAQLNAIPVIFTHHTLYAEYAHYSPFPATLTKQYLDYTVRKFCNSVDHIIAPSRYVQHMLHQNVVKPITVLASPVRDAFITPAHVKKTLTTPLKLLCVSRFEKEKNLINLIDMYTLLNPEEYRLELVGYGSQEDELRSYVKSHVKRPESVTFTVKPSQERLIEAYRTAHLFVFTSQSETQGLVLAEALACGTPIVALNGPGINDTVIDQYNGFLAPNMALMAQFIQKIRGSEELYSELSSNAWDSSLRFTRQHASERLESLYYSLIKRD